MYGPQEPVSIAEHEARYRVPGETFMDACYRLAGELHDDEAHRQRIKHILLDMRFLPGGRIQRAIGAPLAVTPYNCFVSGTIEDDSNSIMDRLREAYFTMRAGGGIGYDFSRLRPRGAMIKSLQSGSSGAVTFMEPFDAVCRTVRSAGGRRGAQMGVLRVDHPDIEEFIAAKQNTDRLTAFNLSIGVTDAFMDAVKYGSPFDLVHDGKVYATIDARALWDRIMRATWDWAEPGVLFIDRINEMNNLWYCETLAATNPCAEQPLPSYGACLLGSFNLTRYVRPVTPIAKGAPRWEFDLRQLAADIPPIIRMMDNIVDRAIYPLPEHAEEARSKRRMGIGVTGVANALEACGYPYASEGYLSAQSKILRVLRDEAYWASIALATEKGRFPLFDAEEFSCGKFIKTLPEELQEAIAKHGIRNSHLLSIAPTGTISLTADNISSGIEPVFSYSQQRTIIGADMEPRTYLLQDYGVKRFGVRGRRADELTPEEHVDVLVAAQHYVDSAISKTCNVGSDVTFKRFREIYRRAYDGGAKGCTTFRAAGKRFGVLNSADEGASCTINAETGEKTCG